MVLLSKRGWERVALSRSSPPAAVLPELDHLNFFFFLFFDPPLLIAYVLLLSPPSLAPPHFSTNLLLLYRTAPRGGRRRRAEFFSHSLRLESVSSTFVSFSSSVARRTVRGGEKGIAQIEFDKVDHRGRPLKYVMITKPCKNLARNNTVSINDPDSVLCARDRIYRRSVLVSSINTSDLPFENMPSRRGKSSLTNWILPSGA